MAEIKAVTDATFDEMVINNERPVLVDFWATWCGPCKMVAPEMEKIAAKYDGAVDVVKVDVDANPSRCCRGSSRRRPRRPGSWCRPGPGARRCRAGGDA